MSVLFATFMSAALAVSSTDDLLLASKKIIEGKSCSSCKSSMSNKDLKQSASKSGGLLIFVSSSLSSQALKELFKDAQKIGAKLIFKGLINNSFKDTHQYFKNIQINADIDPERFSKYDISVVPTFVLTSKKNSQFDRVQGNVSIEEALSQFKDRGDLKNLAARLLKKLRGDQK